VVVPVVVASVVLESAVDEVSAIVTLSSDDATVPASEALESTVAVLVASAPVDASVVVMLVEPAAVDDESSLHAPTTISATHHDRPNIQPA